MTIKKLLQLIIGISIAAFFIWLIFRKINLEEIKQAFVGANLSWVMAALAAFAVGYVCRIERWRLMLQRDNPVLSWSNCAGPLLASIAANNILPFRAGDVLRALAFNRRLGISAGIAITTLFVERLLDLLMLLTLLGVALIFFGLDSSHFIGFGSGALILIAGIILFVLLFPTLFSPLALSIGELIVRIAPKIGHRLLDEITKSLATLKHLAQGHTMIKLVLWTLFAWTAEGCVFWFSALALPSILNPQASWLALPVGTLATLIPSTPGYVGTFDFFTVRAMTELGNASAAATAYALLVHALLWLPPTLVGGVYLLLHPIKQHDQLKAFKL